MQKQNLRLSETEEDRKKNRKIRKKEEKRLKERIEQLATGNILVKQPQLEFSPAYLEGRVEACTVQNRELVIRVKNKIPFKGFFYSTNERVKIGTRQAAGQSAAVLFEINTIDMKPGDEITGAIVAVSNAGENRVEYRYSVCAQTSEQTPVHSLEEFAALYKEKPSEAYQLFVSEKFTKLDFMRGQVQRIAIYEGLLEGNSEYQALEAFAVAMKLKEPIVLKTDVETITFREEELPKEGITIPVTAGSWGWLSAQISADVPWLILPQKKLTSNDFSKQQAVLTVFADVSKMHKGRNTAHLRIAMPMQSIEIVIWVIREYRVSQRPDGRPPKSVAKYLYRLLLAYLNESHEETMIFSQMDQCLEENIKKYPASPGLHLYRVWLLAKQERIPQAQRLLSWYRSNLIRISTRRQQEEQVLIFYLQWMLTKKDSDRQEATRAAQELLKITDSLTASLVWLAAEKDLGAAEKLRQLERMYRIYGAKPIIYAYAAAICRQEPGEVKKTGEFWIQLLSYMLRYGCLTRELAEQYLELPLARVENTLLLYQVMKRMYACYKDRRILTLICSALIRMGKTTPAYASWFELGIDQEINLTGLNDAFMTSVCDQILDRELPNSILLYYSFKNDLDNHTRLNLYTYILSRFPKGTDMYQAYEQQMDEFAIRQLLDGRINAKLVGLYDNWLSPGLIDEHLGHVLTSLLFSKQISCSLPYARKVIVHYAQLRPEQSARITGQEVCIPVYTEDAAILFEDAFGNRYADSDMKLLPLMYREDLVEVCRKKVPGQLMLLVQEADAWYEKPIETDEGMKLAKKLLEKPEVKRTFKHVLISRMVDYCYLHNEDTREYDAWLVSLDPGMLKREQRVRLIELCILRGYGKEAFEYICIYGSDNIRPDLLLKMTVRRITETLYEYNDSLLGLCVHLLKKEQVHETILRYLCMHFSGPTQEMLVLLFAADQAKANSQDLASRVVTQMLFTGETSHLDEAYEICKKTNVSQTLERAVLVVRCHNSLMDESILSEDAVAQLETLFIQQSPERLPEVFSLALLQQYSRQTSLTAQTKRLCEQLLYAYCAKGVYMKCFHGLKNLIELPHQMEGRIIIQWNGTPGCHVRVYGELLPRGKKVVYEMQEIYPGIYTAGVFLFPDETVQISVCCSREGEEETTVKNVLLDPSSCYCRDGSIYGEIHKLIELERKENYEQWKQECVKAIRNREAAKELYTLL